MASRAAETNTRAGQLSALAENGGASSGFALALRVIILSAVVLLVIYTVLTLMQMDRETAPGAQGTRAAAELLAAQAQAAAERLRTSAKAAAITYSEGAREPLDAAEHALRLAAPLASAAAIVRGAEVVASTGAPARVLAWGEIAALAAKSGKPVWIGAPEPAAGAGRGRWTYVVARARPGPENAAVVVLAADLQDLTSSTTGQVQVLASADGVILSGSGVGRGAADLSALGLDPAHAIAGAAAQRDVPGLIRADRPAMISTALSADRDFIAAVAAPSTALVAARQRNMAYKLFSLIAPLAIGGGLLLMLMAQTRRAEKARQAQSESERKFRMAVEAARCGIWEWRLRQNQVLISDVTGVMFGWGGGGTVGGEDLIDRIAPEHQDRVRQALRGAAAYGGFDVSFRVPRSGGRMAWIDVRGQAFGEMDALGYATLIGVALDVTEERTAEQRAQAAERRLHDAIDSVSEAFVLWDRHGRLLMCNRNFRDFFSLEPRVLKPGASRESVQKLAELAVRRHAPASGNRRAVRELELVDGRWIQISERRTADGGLVMTAADITVVKRQEEARRLNEEALQHAVVRLEESSQELSELAEKYQAEKIRAESANTAKSGFLANMSHELRTPLNAINGFSEMMVNEMFGSLGDPRYREYAQDILSSGQHLLALINDILDMSKIEAGKMSLNLEWIDVGELVEDAVRLMRNRAETAKLELRTTVAPGVPEIEADHRSIKQVLLNLLSNAVKFTPQGGRVEVKVWTLDEETGAARVRISVSDTGVGISRADLGRLAKPFEQVEVQHSKSQQGTGLGLALSKSLIEMHDGAFELDSEPGLGTTVTFTLPVQRARRSKGVALAPTAAVLA